MLHVKSFHRELLSGSSVALDRVLCCGGAATPVVDGNPARGQEPGVRMNGIFGMHGVKLFTGAAVSVLLLTLAGPTPALADTIESALVRAYQNNPQLNAQRAQVRSTDENVPQALSGYRPKVAVTASAGVQYTDTLSTARGSAANLSRVVTHRGHAPPTARPTLTPTP